MNSRSAIKIVIFCIMLSSSCSSNSGEKPIDVFNEFCSAAESMDVLKFKSYLSDNFKNETDNAPVDDPGRLYKVFMTAVPHSAQISFQGHENGSYIIRGKGKSHIGQTEGHVKLIDQNGSWKIEESRFNPINSRSIENPTQSNKDSSSFKTREQRREEFRRKNNTGIRVSGAGSIFFRYGHSSEGDKVIMVLSNNTWLLRGKSIGSNLFDRQISKGSISSDGLLLNLPPEVYSSYAKVWKKGDITADINGQTVKPL